MAEIYDFLDEIMPIKRVLISLAVGMVSLFIVLISGLTSDFVRSEIIASRVFSAFSFSTLASFILMMGGEEYAIFKTKRELETFIDSAQIAETAEAFDKDEYLHEDVEEIPDEVRNEPMIETGASETFPPINIGDFSSQS